MMIRRRRPAMDCGDVTGRTIYGRGGGEREEG